MPIDASAGAKRLSLPESARGFLGKPGPSFAAPSEMAASNCSVVPCRSSRASASRRARGPTSRLDDLRRYAAILVDVKCQCGAGDDFRVWKIAVPGVPSVLSAGIAVPKARFAVPVAVPSRQFAVRRHDFGFRIQGSGFRSAAPDICGCARQAQALMSEMSEMSGADINMSGVDLGRGFASLASRDRLPPLDSDDLRTTASGFAI
jgi:hypothetical protein